jgi:hypothetical protein
MKKTYIKPETTVVALNVRDNVLQAGSVVEVQGITGFKKGDEYTSGSYDSGAREVIEAPDAWEEW